MARGRGPVHRDRAAAGGRRRGARAGAGAPLSAPLVDPRRGPDRGASAWPACSSSRSWSSRCSTSSSRCRAAAPVGGGAARRPGRHRRGRGAPRGRQQAHHRRQRLRGRTGRDQAGGALRQPDRGLPARPGALGGGPRAGARRAPRPASRACCGWRSWRCPARCWCSASPSGWPGRPAAEPAARRSYPRWRCRWRWCPSRSGCAGNVLSRQVEASADAFALRLTDEPGGLHRPGAPPGAQQRLPAGSAGAHATAVRHPPDHGGADRGGRGLRPRQR